MKIESLEQELMQEEDPMKYPVSIALNKATFERFNLIKAEVNYLRRSGIIDKRVSFYNLLRKVVDNFLNDVEYSVKMKKKGTGS